VEKGLEVPCLFMITEVSIRCQKTRRLVYGVYPRIPPIHHWSRCNTLRQVIDRPAAAKRYAPADGSSTRGGSTSVRGRVRSPHISAGSQRAYSQAVVPRSQRAIASAGTDRRTDGRTDGSRYRLMPPNGGGIITRHATLVCRQFAAEISIIGIFKLYNIMQCNHCSDNVMTRLRSGGKCQTVLEFIGLQVKNIANIGLHLCKF